MIVHVAGSDNWTRKVLPTRGRRATSGEAPAIALDRATTWRRSTLMAVVVATAMALALSWAPLAHGNSPVFGFVYTADEHGNSVSRIALETGKVQTRPLRIAPHNVQVVPSGNLLLVVGLPVRDESRGAHGSGSSHGEIGYRGGSPGSTPTAGQLVVLHTDDFPSAPNTSITVGGAPAHVIADEQGNHAYVTISDEDKLAAVDLEKGRVVAMVATGDSPHGLRMSPSGKSIYVANTGDGTVSVIDTVSLVETARIKVGSAPVQVAFTPDARRVYVSLRDDNEVAVIDTATQQVVATIGVGRSPIQLHATPDGRFVYVANEGTEEEPDHTVSIIDVAGEKVVKTINTGGGAHGVAVSSDDAFVFVSNAFDNTVSQVSVESQCVVRTYRVGKGPAGITYEDP